MKLNLNIWCLCAGILFGQSNALISDEDYKLMPSIFHIDNYDKCVKENKLYCKMNVILSPVDAKNPPAVWKIIQETKSSNRYYNHEELHYAICVTDYCKDIEENPSDLPIALEKCLSKKFENLHLKAGITNVDCEYDTYKIRVLDVVILVLMLSYFLLCIYATFHDINKKRSNKYLVPFSARHNLAKLRETYNSNNRKIKSMETLRLIVTCMVISAHNYQSFASGYISNTKFIEEFADNAGQQTVLNLMTYAIQPFFLFSGWIMAYYSLKQLQHLNKKYWPKYIALSCLNRFLRLVPPILPLLAVGTTVWLQYFHRTAPLHDLYYGREFHRCNKNWWQTLFFMNNHYGNEICFPNTWYLSADTKLYTVSLIILTLTFNLSLRVKAMILGGVALGGMLLTAIMSYLYDVDIVYRFPPKDYTYFTFVDSFEFYSVHASTYSNTATYMLGILFGYFYLKYENVNLFKTKTAQLAWWVTFIGLPVYICYISCYTYAKITTTLLAPVVKPLFAFGIGVGIFGMMQGMGGILKSFLEWRPLVFMGNFTYSTYLVHLGIIMYKTSATTEVMEVSWPIMNASYFPGLIASICAGIFLHVFVEMPALQFQNIILPKPRAPEKKD